VYAPGKILASRELAQDPVDAYEQRACGTKAIVFCSTVEHARQTAESFSQRGYRSRWLSGESRDREEIVESFSKRDFDILVNVNCLIEGFDDPAIETAILARRFTHVGSYLQALGRILRPFPGKTQATAIDLCGSALVHGTPDIEREFSLDGKGISTTRQPIRQCQECGGVFVSASAQECPFCDFKLPALTRAQAKALGIKLEEVSNSHKPTSWPMRAKRRGFCSSCRGLVMQGEWIVYSAASKQAMHTRCAARVQRKAAA
jgi:superfamily II DNA or RNA helicase